MYMFSIIFRYILISILGNIYKIFYGLLNWKEIFLIFILDYLLIYCIIIVVFNLFELFNEIDKCIIII